MGKRRFSVKLTGVGVAIFVLVAILVVVIVAIQTHNNNQRRNEIYFGFSNLGEKGNEIEYKYEVTIRFPGERVKEYNTPQVREKVVLLKEEIQQKIQNIIEEEPKR